MTNSFFTACVTLRRDGQTRFSLIGTSLFWGRRDAAFSVGAVVPVALVLPIMLRRRC